MKVFVKMVSAKDNTPVVDLLYTSLDWGNYTISRDIFVANSVGIAPGRYKLIFEMEGEVSSFDFEVAS